jgi:hypothetical protein
MNNSREFWHEYWSQCFDIVFNWPVGMTEVDRCKMLELLQAIPESFLSIT